METEFHFYASSFTTWMTTTPERDLREIIKRMDKEGNHYKLWYVPKPHNAAYKISNYAPMVEGAIFIGDYYPKKKK